MIAVGRTSRVHRYGSRAVAKVLNHGVPDHWAEIEASMTSAVRALGVCAPDVLDVVDVDGRPAILFERVDGPSMWQLMHDDPASIPTLAREFAAVQRQIHRVGVPDLLPGFVDRVQTKIGDVVDVGEADREAAREMVRALPAGAALLHGDFHPGNLLVAEAGITVIDWFDASVGHPMADVMRSALLVDAEGLTDRRHVPGATDEQLRALHDAYLDEMTDLLDHERDRRSAWCAVTALSRIAERTDDDVDLLVDRWSRHRQAAMADGTAR